MSWTPTDEQVGKAYDEWDDPAPWSGPCYCAGFLAGYEAAHRERCPHQKCPGGSLCCCTDQAATRTRVVTTVTELDALPVGSVVLDSGGGWTWTHVDDTERRDEEGDRLRRAWACVAYRSDRTAAEMFHGGGRRIGVGVGPFRVLYDPEEAR